MASTKQINKEKPAVLDLESEEQTTPLEMELKQYEDPGKQEEARKRLNDFANKLEQLSKASEITIKKIYSETKGERGLINKTAHWIKRLKDKMTSDGSTSYDSINFMSATVKTLNEYRQSIPLHIKEFQIAIDKLKLGQADAKKMMKDARLEIERISKEWNAIKEKIETVNDKEKQAELMIIEQDLRDALQNAEIKGNKHMKKLQNYTNTREMFLGLKSSYETLLQQLGDLETTLKEHLKILKTVGPSVKEVENVVISISKFTQTIDEYRQRDNQAVRFATAAVKEISPAVQELGNAWYGEKTVEQVKKNAKQAKEVYRKSFGTDIKKLEEYDLSPPKAQRENETAENN